MTQYLQVESDISLKWYHCKPILQDVDGSTTKTTRKMLQQSSSTYCCENETVSNFKKIKVLVASVTLM